MDNLNNTDGKKLHYIHYLKTKKKTKKACKGDIFDETLDETETKKKPRLNPQKENYDEDPPVNIRILIKIGGTHRLRIRILWILKKIKIREF